MIHLSKEYLLILEEITFGELVPQSGTRFLAIATNDNISYVTHLTIPNPS